MANDLFQGSDLTTPHLLSKGGLSRLAELVKELGLDAHFSGDASLVGSDPVIQSPHRLGEASATAQLLIGVAASSIWQARGGSSSDVSIDIADALHFLHPTHFIEQQGKQVNVGAENVAVNGLFQCRDGRYVMLEAGPPYPKLLQGYTTFFDCGDSKASYAREVAKWDSADLEEALSNEGLPACRAFSREEWLEQPQGKLLSAVPVIEIEKIADGEPVPFSPGAQTPLEGIRVLDFTHVLAGPRSARTLAEFGADVLHISSPSFPDTLAQHLGVDLGKRCAYLDLRDTKDLERMAELAAETDVFTSTYRTSVNRRFGLTPELLAKHSKRGIVYMTANAYGHSGPWAERPGFDQNGQTASGFAVAEGGDGPPRFSPVFYLADLITGYLAAAGMMAALLRRAKEGGSYHVKLSLTRSAMWVQDLGLLDVDRQANIPKADIYPRRSTTVDTAFGKVTQLTSPPLSFSTLPLPKPTTLMPFGAAEPIA